MDLLKFYSCVNSGEAPISEYQIDLGLPDYKQHYMWKISARALRDFEIDVILLYKLDRLKIYEINDFLDYHYLLCDNQIRFLTYTKHIIALGLEYNNKQHEDYYQIEGVTIKKLFESIIIAQRQADECLNWIEKKTKLIEAISTLPQLSKEKAPQQNEIEPTNSFKYITRSQQEHIEGVFNKLKQNDKNIMFISDEVKLTDFKKIFNNTLLNKINPINWQKSKASLRYFIKQFPFDMSDKNLFKITYCCFNYIDKKDYTQIQNAKQKGEKDKTAIDNIFKTLPFQKVIS